MTSFYTVIKLAAVKMQLLEDVSVVFPTFIGDTELRYQVECDSLILDNKTPWGICSFFRMFIFRSPG